MAPLPIPALETTRTQWEAQGYAWGLFLLSDQQCPGWCVSFCLLVPLGLRAALSLAAGRPGREVQTVSPGPALQGLGSASPSLG